MDSTTMRLEQLRGRQAYLEDLVNHWLRLVVRHKGTIQERKIWLGKAIDQLEEQGDAGAAQVLRERVLQVLETAEQDLND
ncbi:hypothetical protein [Leptolyngbya sp. FACHB-261]|uniref:hypothetical protein n=1 Tax=Leptolyngbya sp. FACHB-261 TaxID=2692806 RepID=UPI001687A409|nr:hypothetical protein [Leptolyngbya sp. FACHB-261]MBD2099668.1 hypothetical protein [Leptolyngbya sp. FACHB-261]